MANDTLFGTLHTPLKPIHYTGIDTKTVDVIVDSEKRTIRANIQPEVLNAISANVSALKSAYEKLTSLSNEIEQVKRVITNIYNDLANDINNVEQDLKKVDLTVVETIGRLSRIEDDYKHTGYDIQSFVEGKIEDKIVELQEGTLELNTYAKVADVAKEVTRLDSDIATKVAIETFETFSQNIEKQFADVDTMLNETNTRIDLFEAAIGPLPTDKTLKEEIFETFATNEALEAVQNTAGQNSVLLRDVDSELFDIKKSLEDDYATKQYVSDEISKIDIPVGPGGEVDLSNYYTKSQTEDKIEEALNAITFISASIDNI